MYEKLAKFYYKHPSEYQNEYQKRLNDYASVQLGFNIKPLKANEEFSCFYVNHRELASLHEKILRNNGIIRTLMTTLPTAALQNYVQTKLIDELVNTNKIEGIRSTRAEMKRVLIIEKPEVSPKKQVRFWSFVNSYRYLLENSAWMGIENVQEIRQIYDNLVAGEVDLGDELDGELFRKNGVDIINGAQKVIHKGLLPESEIIKSLEKLVDFLNHHDSPKLYKIAIAHYYFGYIHPFYDGNGRTSRYISSLYLKDELEILTALTLSHATHENKKRYYSGFDDASDRLNKGELTHFCQAFFEILLFAQEHIMEELNTKTAMLQRLFEKIDIELESLNYEEKQIVLTLGEQHLFGFVGDGIAKKEIEETLEYSSYKMNKAFEVLVEHGIIKYTKKKPIAVILTDEFLDSLE